MLLTFAGFKSASLPHYDLVKKKKKNSKEVKKIRQRFSRPETWEVPGSVGAGSSPAAHSLKKIVSSWSRSNTFSLCANPDVGRCWLVVKPPNGAIVLELWVLAGLGTVLKLWPARWKKGTKIEVEVELNLFERSPLKQPAVHGPVYQELHNRVWASRCASCWRVAKVFDDSLLHLQLLCTHAGRYLCPVKSYLTKMWPAWIVFQHGGCDRLPSLSSYSVLFLPWTHLGLF